MSKKDQAVAVMEEVVAGEGASGKPLAIKAVTQMELSQVRANPANNPARVDAEDQTNNAENNSWVRELAWKIYVQGQTTPVMVERIPAVGEAVDTVGGFNRVAAIGLLKRGFEYGRNAEELADLGSDKPVWLCEPGIRVKVMLWKGSPEDRILAAGRENTASKPMTYMDKAHFIKRALEFGSIKRSEIAEVVCRGSTGLVNELVKLTMLPRDIQEIIHAWYLYDQGTTRLSTGEAKPRKWSWRPAVLVTKFPRDIQEKAFEMVRAGTPPSVEMLRTWAGGLLEEGDEGEEDENLDGLPAPVDGDEPPVGDEPPPKPPKPSRAPKAPKMQVSPKMVREDMDLVRSSFEFPAVRVFLDFMIGVYLPGTITKNRHKKLDQQIRALVYNTAKFVVGELQDAKKSPLSPTFNFEEFYAEILKNLPVPGKQETLPATGKKK